MNPLKLLKRLIWIPVMLVVALVALGFFADGLAKKGIEAGGSEALGVEATVESCDIGFFDSTFSLRDLAIANPEGYGPEKFLELGSGAVEVSALSLLSDKVELPALEMSKIRLRLVQRLRGSNYGTILDHLEAFQGGSSSDEGKRFVIEKLVISDVVVSVVPVRELKLGAIEIPIDRIELTNVGSESDKGVLLSELAGIVVESILKRTSASGQLPHLLKGALDGKLGGLSGLANAGVKALDGVLPGGLPKGVDDAKSELEKRLKGFGIK